MEKSNKVKEQFDALYAEWEKVVQDPEVQISSRPQDYINNEPYRGIVKLGKDALPFILEKIEHGVFFMNDAALKISGKNLDQIIAEEKEKPLAAGLDFLVEKEPKFLSEQEKSKLILRSVQEK